LQERIDVSSSRGESRLTIAGGGTTLEIEVIDSNFEAVASSVGALDIEVEPGLYELRFREGSAQTSRLLKAEAGTNVVEPPRFDPVSPAPVDNTSTTHEYHQELVIEATRWISKQSAGPRNGGIIVMVRNGRGADHLAFPDGLSRRFSVVDANLDAVDDFGAHWQERPDQGWALWRKAVVAGGYAIRIEDSAADGEVLYQSLWVDEGWQTMVFIPNTAEGPASELATVHIARLGEWTPWADGSATAIALESVLAGLRAGRSVVPENLGQLFEAKFVNPFLGIAAAHALLIDPASSIKLLETVVENLERLTPLNPDVIALAHRARRAGADVRPQQGVAWPPMMYIGYRALLRADANTPGVVVDNSLAESAAALLRVAGLWTTWTRSAAPSDEGARRFEIDGDADEEALDPAAERVFAYVQGAAKVAGVSQTDILSQRSLKQLALATGLPSASVRGAVSKLRADLE
jgi:hypothetical protein